MCSLLHRTAPTGMQTRKPLGTLRWRSGAQRPPRLSPAATWWSATSRWTTSNQLQLRVCVCQRRSVCFNVTDSVLRGKTAVRWNSSNSWSGPTARCRRNLRIWRTWSRRSNAAHHRGTWAWWSTASKTDSLQDFLPNQRSFDMTLSGSVLKEKQLKPQKEEFGVSPGARLKKTCAALRSLLVIKSHFYNLLANHEFKMYICI